MIGGEVGVGDTVGPAIAMLVGTGVGGGPPGSAVTVGIGVAWSIAVGPEVIVTATQAGDTANQTSPTY